ncbi:MAG: Com family DNA-binding transcriptional regulator [Bacillota bacterium]|nr:Com family DNA-binding transcriptional regulator [Bacillota bacterium]
MSIISAAEKNSELQGELRCICNRLICKVQDGAIEIKCPKCKRLIKISVSSIKQIEYL